jgi:hypothetical protein
MRLSANTIRQITRALQEWQSGTHVDQSQESHVELELTLKSELDQVVDWGSELWIDFCVTVHTFSYEKSTRQHINTAWEKLDFSG